jgi:hypothetical protein
MTVQPPDWVTAIPSAPGIHTEPARSYQWQSLSADQQRALWVNLVESIVQQVIMAIEGFLLPGNALAQLTSWASGIPILGDFLAAITGSSTTGGGGYAGLNAWFVDLMSIFGNPLALGTGSPTVPGSPTSIPLLDSLFGGGGLFHSSLFPDITRLMSGDLQGVIDSIWQAVNGGSSTGHTAPSVLTNISAMVAQTQDTIDTIWQSITGSSGTGNLLSDLFDSLQNIPALNILGIAGPANIGASIQAGWDQLISGLTGTPGGTGSTLADQYNVPFTVSSNAALGQYSWDILGIRNNKPMEHGLLATSESNVSLSKVGLASSAPTFAVTSTTSTMAFSRAAESVDKGVVSWLGYGNTGITDFRVVIWKMDITTGSLASVVHTSTNQAGLLASGSTPQWSVYSLPSTVHVDPGDVYGIELCAVGGTHNVVGQSTWLPDHPSSFPKNLAASRNSGTTFPPTAPHTPTSSSNVPWIEFGVAVSGTPAPHSPETRYFSTAGATTTIIPSIRASGRAPAGTPGTGPPSH